MSTTAAPAGSTEQTLHVSGMSCAACQAHVQRALESVPGVQSASVDLLAHKAHVTGTTALDPAVLTAAVRGAGYDVVGQRSAQESATASTDHPEDTSRFLGSRAVFSLIAGAAAMVLSMPLMAGSATLASDPLNRFFMHLLMPLMPAALMHIPAETLRWILFVLAAATMLFAAPEIYRAAWRAARHGATNMNTLVALGTLSAFCVSVTVTLAAATGHPLAMFGDVYYEAVILILAFLLAGRWLEARARHRAMRDLHSFARMEVKEARWLTDTAPPDPEALLTVPETLLPLDAISVGDLLRALPGDRIPLDAEILAGRSSVEESMLTGEPLPVTRGAGDRVLGGTLNLDGPLVLRAAATGANSTLAQMNRLLDRARSTRAPMQRLADRASSIFVPTVLLIAAITFAVWAVADDTGNHHAGFARAISLAIAVLVIACPCAMGLAVPAAVAVSLGTAARAGLLFKDGEGIERLAKARVMVFDKTGTLTEGRPQISAFELSPKATYSREQLLAWANAVEQISTHPLASSIREFSSRNHAPSSAAVKDGRVLPGTGAEATIDGHHIGIGNSALLTDADRRELAPPKQHFEFATPMYLLVDGVHQATFYAADALRASAKHLAPQIQSLGLHPVLLTGDTLQAARAIAAQAGIDDIRARLLPADKASAISDMQRQGLRVAMTGDGLNDAAALAQADAGITVASGTDLAREAGHILLLHEDLRLIPLAVRLARKTRRLMRQNLGWAVGYNLIGIPVAAGLLLPRYGIALSPALASAAMAFSSVSVLLNSLRLARIRGQGLGIKE